MGVKVGVATMEISGKYGSGEEGRGEMGDGGKQREGKLLSRLLYEKNPFSKKKTPINRSTK